MTTTCAYCGVGCSLDVHVRDDEVVAIDPALEGPSNLGHTCVKGRFAHQYARSPERLTSPMMRRTDGTWREASWDEAMGFVADKMKAIAAEHGPDAIAFISSSRCTNEENYILQKLARAALGTNNIDNCSRVCHSPTSFGLIQSLGESGGTNSFADIDVTECLFLTGANPTEGHPVVGARMKEARLRGAKLIVADPRRIELAAMADVFLQLRPGTNVALYNGLAHVIVRDGLYDKAFVDTRRGLRGVRRASSQLRSEERRVDHRRPGRAHREGGAPLRDDAARLDLLRARRHRAGAGRRRRPLPREPRDPHRQPRQAGQRVEPAARSEQRAGLERRRRAPDLPHDVPEDGRRRAPAVRGEVGRQIQPERGLMIPEMFDAAVDERSRRCTSSARTSRRPIRTSHVDEALRSLELLVGHDIFENVTAKFAHVMLPGSSFLEKTGTFTNAERRVQMVRERPPAGRRAADLDILFDLSKRLGYEMRYETRADVMDEIAEMTPRYAASRTSASAAGPPVAGPVEGRTGTPVLYTEKFATPSGAARFGVAG